MSEPSSQVFTLLTRTRHSKSFLPHFAAEQDQSPFLQTE